MFCIHYYIHTDCFVYARNHPGKAAFYSSSATLLCLAWHTSPTFAQYKDHLLSASNNHALISDAIRSGRSQKAVTELMQCHTQERLQHMGLGLGALIVRLPASASVDMYANTCASLQPRRFNLADWKERIVDYGFASRWFALEKHMEDYDVNEDEWPEQTEAKL